MNREGPYIIKKSPGARGHDTKRGGVNPLWNPPPSSPLCSEWGAPQNPIWVKCNIHVSLSTQSLPKKKKREEKKKGVWVFFPRGPN